MALTPHPRKAGRQLGVSFMDLPTDGGLITRLLLEEIKAQASSSNAPISPNQITEAIIKKYYRGPASPPMPPSYKGFRFLVLASWNALVRGGILANGSHINVLWEPSLFYV